MHQIDSADAVGSPPTPLAPGTPGHFGNGTTVRADWLNAVQGELIAFLALLGGTADKTVNNQISLLVAKHLLGLTAAASGSFSTAPSYDRALLAGTGTVSGSKSAAVAAEGATASGAKSAVIGGTDNIASNTNAVVAGGELNEAAGARSFVGGGEGNRASGAASVVFGGTSNVCEVAGAGGAVVGGDSNSVEALYAAVIGNVGNAVSGDGAAAVGHFGGVITANGDSSVALGGATANIDAERAATIGGADNAIAESGCVIVGSDNCQIPATTNKTNIVILGSKRCDPDLGTTEDYMVCGGYHASVDTAPSWRIESQGGTLHATNTTVQGLDYAEFMPNADGVAHEPGQLLTTRGLGVTLAKRGDELAGGVSVTPTITGGDDSIAWRGRYERDEWGAVVYETVIVDSAKPDRAAMKVYKAQRLPLVEAENTAKSARRRARARLDAARAADPQADNLAELEQALALAVDEHVAARAAREALPKPAPIVTQKTMRVPKLSPNYRPGKHVPRSKRPSEWTRVGLLGQIRVRVDDTVGPDMSVVAGDVPGRGTAGPWIGRGAQFRCLAITSAFDPARGYAIALCLVR